VKDRKFITPIPIPDVTPSAVRGLTNNITRSLESREERDALLTERRTQQLVQNVTTIKVPFALEDMNAKMCGGKPLEQICNEDLADISPQCFSAKFIDSNNKTILFYFGFQHPKERHRNKVRSKLRRTFDLDLYKYLSLYRKLI
jgi:hypothetical protein